MVKPLPSIARGVGWISGLGTKNPHGLVPKKPKPKTEAIL